MTVVGLGLGSSVFLGFGFYELVWWGTLALLFLVVALAVSIGWPSRPTGASLVAISGLVAVWLWSLLSTRWAESADQAMLEASRWLFYAAVLITLIAVLRGRRLERLLLGAAILPIVATGMFLLARMAIGDGSGMFLGNRLNEPLDYVNGLAAFLLMAVWPLLALAERARNPALGGIALGAAAMLCGLTAMTQSRGATLALAASAAILLAIVPGRVRRGWALVGVAAVLVGCAGPLGDVFAALPPGEVPSDDTIGVAARWIVGLSILVGAVWAATTQLGWLRPDRSDGGKFSRFATAGLISVALAGLVVVGLPISDRFDRLEEQYDAFTELQGAGEGSRLVTGGGNRYDYWRVAIDQFEDAPVRGIGAGNYDTTYFRDRQTTENIRNPHSLGLQALGETGLVGALAVLLFVAGVGWGLSGRARRASPLADAGLAVAAGGVFLVWVVQTSVDWLHLIPGLTGVMLCAAAALIAPSARGWIPRSSNAGRAAAVTGGLVVAFAAALIAGPLLADRFVTSGRDRLSDDPAEAVERARDALEANDESIAAYQLEAAGLAKQGDYEGARAALLEATEREPSDYVNWALLGDLAVRRGDTPAADRAYARALQLNPLEPGLQVAPSGG